MSAHRVWLRGYAVAGCAVPDHAPGGPSALSWPDGRTVPLPPPGAHPRRARLPALAAALAELAAAPLGRPAPEATAVLLASAYGCQTETASFVENMIRAGEATPKPRAFSASVHNAPAAQVALALGARGENQTFVQGALGLHQALFAAWRRAARGARGPLLVGALDERTPYSAQGTSRCAARPDGSSDEGHEGGAMLLGEVAPVDAPPADAVALLRAVRFARPRDPASWLRSALALDPEEAGLPEVVLVPCARDADELGWPEALPYPALVGDHPAASATAAALALAVLGGELAPMALGTLGTLARAQAPRSLALVARSRFGELGVAVFTAARP